MKNLFIHIPKTGGYTIRCTEGVTSYVHHTASELSSRLPDFWERYIFCMVRNPYDRFLSAFMYYKQMQPGHMFWHIEMDRNCAIAVQDYDTFEDFVWDFSAFRFRNRIHFLPQVDWVQLGDTPVMNYIGRFEDYDNSWRHICREIGIPYRRLPVVNKSRHAPWQEYYTRPMRIYVKDLFKEDFHAFGY